MGYIIVTLLIKVLRGFIGRSIFDWKTTYSFFKVWAKFLLLFICVYWI